MRYVGAVTLLEPKHTHQVGWIDHDPDQLNPTTCLIFKAVPYVRLELCTIAVWPKQLISPTELPSISLDPTFKNPPQGCSIDLCASGSNIFSVSVVRLF